MVKCSFCKNKIMDSLPHKCKFCKEMHCSKHLLPESHDCIGLEEYKKESQEKWKKAFSSNRVKHGDSFKEYEPKNHEKNKKVSTNKSESKKHKEINVKNKLTDYVHRKYKNLVYWLKKREKPKYAFEKRINYLLTISLILFASLVGFNIFYSNAPRLNEIELWIINLGGILILTSLFFFVKYGWKLGEILVLEVDEKIRGVVVFKTEHWWEGLVILIEDLVVEKNYEEQRRNLLSKVEEYGSSINTSSISFATHKESDIGFYTSQGFNIEKNTIFLRKKIVE